MTAHFDHGEPEVGEFGQRERSYFRTESEFDKRPRVRRVGERDRHVLLFKPIDHHGLIL